MIAGLQILDHIRTCQHQVFKASMDGDLVALRLTDPEHRRVPRKLHPGSVGLVLGCELNDIDGQ